MGLRKLPSGRYQYRKTINGKEYTLLLDHMPGKREEREIEAELKARAKTFTPERMTFQKAAEGYCEAKSNVLSPSTIVGYNKMLRQLSDDFKRKQLNDITPLDIQVEINRLAGILSPKSVSNISGFLRPVLRMFRPGLQYDITLPDKIPVDYYIPTEDEVRSILDYVRGTRYYIPFMLGVFGLRRSEVCALDLSDLEGNILHVHKAKVQNIKKEWIIKKYNKTERSHRDVYIPDALAELIKEQGFIFDQHPERLYDHLCIAQDKLGIKHFRLHDLRHYYVSYAHALGIPDEYIMQQGGWKTDYVMKKVYRHAFQAEYEKAAAKFAENFMS